MSFLSEYYAGGHPEAVLIETLQLECSAWDEPLFLRTGFQDSDLYVPELGEFRTFISAPFKADHPKRDGSGAQRVRIVIDNVYEDARKLIVMAAESEAEINVYVRWYAHFDPSMPVSRTIKAEVKQAEIDGPTVNIEAGFFDVLNTNFNRLTYNSETAPAIQYE